MINFIVPVMVALVGLLFLYLKKKHRGKGVSMSSYGMQTFDANGNLIFDSTTSRLRLVDERIVTGVSEVSFTYPTKESERLVAWILPMNGALTFPSEVILKVEDKKDEKPTEQPKVEEKTQVTPEQPKVEEKPQVTPEQPKPEEKPQVTPEQPKSEENTQTPTVEQPSNPTNDDKLSNLKDTLVAKLPGDEEVTVKFKAKDVTGIHFVAQNSNEQKVNEVKELVKNLDENLNVVKTLDLFFTDDNGNVINNNGETRAVTVAVLAKDNETLEVYYVNGDKLEKVPSSYSDGKLTFYTDHFSTYTIVSRTNNNGSHNQDSNTNSTLSTQNNNINVGNNPISQRFNNILPKTGLTENSVGALLLGILGIGLAVLGFRRKR